jgi:hypothetical protein
VHAVDKSRLIAISAEARQVLKWATPIGPQYRGELAIRLSNIELHKDGPEHLRSL